MKLNCKRIGILGGMGPEATAALYLKVVRLFQQKLGSMYDDEFPEIFIYNLPLPDVVKSNCNKSKVEISLRFGLKKLERAGVDLIAIPCNTVFYYLSKMPNLPSVPIINILEETAIEVRKQGSQTLGLLATKLTVDSKIYSQFLNCKIVTPDTPDQQKVTDVILSILSGKQSKEDLKILTKIAKKLRSVDSVLLGCTELSLLKFKGLKIIDPLQILARSVVRKAIDI